MNIYKRILRRLRRAWLSRATQRVSSGLEIYTAVTSSNTAVVSIDLFDTIVYRRCHKPVDVFAIQYFQSGFPRNICNCVDDWVRLRTTVERDLTIAAGVGEISLAAIYDDIRKILGLSELDITTMKQSELMVEETVVRAYPEVVAVLSDLAKLGKVIVVNTDTYLPQEFIERLLKKILPFSFELLCSSDTNKPKRSGLAFDLLRQKYRVGAILHFGDNLVSDVLCARARGVSAVLVDWKRARFIERNLVWLNHLAAMNCRQFSTPFDLEVPEGESELTELAWRWAVVLTDFALQVSKTTALSKIDEIWLLSRDCESLYAALSPLKAVLFPSTSLRYVYTSRAATYPIMATEDPARFERWMGRAPSLADCENGKSLTEAYRKLVSEQSKTILLVDVGWKGRIQVAMQHALDDKDIHGIYFSLDPLAESESRSKSSTFVEWSRSYLNQAATEALAGFTGQSCKGYRQLVNGDFEPTFVERVDDHAPEAYCGALRRFVYENISLNSGVGIRTASSRSRQAVLSATLVFPDSVVAHALKNWSMGGGLAGDGVFSMISGGRASLIQKLAGREVSGNLWPEIAMWGIVKRSFFVRLLQLVMNLRKRAFAR